MPTDLSVVEECALRAGQAEAAVHRRHLRRLWGLPRTRLGVSGWPATLRERKLVVFNYWWQAHLLDCAIDAANRDPTSKRRNIIANIVRGIRIHNGTGWTNAYYDDMAWLAIALERADRMQGVLFRNGIADVRDALLNGFNPAFGAVVWRVGDDFYNAPANGPAGIALARLGHPGRAQQLADFMDDRLRDKDTGLIFDGIRLPEDRVETAVYSYCQGVVLGLETELAVRTGAARHAERARSLTAAIIAGVTSDGVINGGGGGDGGLFGGILARYLAFAAIMLPGSDASSERTRADAAHIVRASAAAAWNNRAEVKGLPLFGPYWAQPAAVPGSAKGAATFAGGTVRASEDPAHDLSVQLSAWMLLEANYQLAAAGL